MDDHHRRLSRSSSELQFELSMPEHELEDTYSSNLERQLSGPSNAAAESPISEQLQDACSSTQERDIGYSPPAPDYTFPDLQETTYRNAYIRAYQEIMRVAMDTYTWIGDLPGIGSLRDVTVNPVEMSTASAVFPIAASDMVSMMMNVAQWERSLSHIIHSTAEFNTGNAFEYLQKEDAAIKNVVGVYTKVQLPTTFIPSWDFHCLRILKEIDQGIYAIIDISRNFFDNNEETNPKLSGVIIRDNGQDSEIIWLQSMNLREASNVQHSQIFRARWTFDAEYWMSALLWKLKRQSSAFLEHNINVNDIAGRNLLEIADSMKLFYKKCVAKVPYENMFEVYTHVEDKVRLMGMKRSIAEDILDLAVCICVSSFYIRHKTPLSVFQFLVKKNLQLLFSSHPNPEEPELLLKFATDDDSNSITLHRKKIGEHYEYYLQEASRDVHCSYVMSRPMSQDEVDFYITSGPQSLNPLRWETRHNTAVSGFAIMSDWPKRLNSDGALVTCVMQLNRHPRVDFVQALNAVKNEINDTGTKIVGLKEEEVNAKSSLSFSMPMPLFLFVFGVLCVSFFSYRRNH